MIHVGCPWCDGPMAVDEAQGEGACERCGVTVELAAERELALAAA